jgi:hypothetical protein
MKNVVVILASAISLAACSSGAVSPPAAPASTQQRNALSSNVYALHFVIPIDAPADIFDGCTNPAFVITGTEIGKLETNEQFGSAGNLEIFHYEQTSLFQSDDGTYSGRYSAGSPSVINYVDGFTVATGHIVFTIMGPSGRLRVQETSHFAFGANGKPSVTHDDLKVLCASR